MTMINITGMSQAEIDAAIETLLAKKKADADAAKAGLDARYQEGKAKLDAEYEKAIAALKLEVYGERKTRASRVVATEAVTYSNGTDTYTTGTPGRPPQWVTAAKDTGTLEALRVSPVASDVSASA